MRLRSPVIHREDGAHESHEVPLALHTDLPALALPHFHTRAEQSHFAQEHLLRNFPEIIFLRP